MKLNHITFHVRDIRKTVAFYQNLVGLQVVRQFNPGRGEIVFMVNESHETHLEFIQFDGVEKVSAVGMTLSFHVNRNLESVRQKAIEMGYAPSEIIETPPKPQHFTVLDPDQIPVEFSI